MNREEIKKVFRFTNHLHDSFKPPELSLDEIRKVTDRLEREVRMLAIKVKHRNTRTMLNRDWYTVSSLASNLADRAYQWNRPQYLFNQQKPIAFRHLSLDTMSLVTRGATVDLGSRDDRLLKKLLIPVSPFTLRDRNGDDWKFKGLVIEFIIEGRDFEVSVSGPDFEDQGHCHPHIGDNGDICKGDAGEAIRNGLNTRDLLSVYDMVEALLRTYNPEDPYFKLENIRGNSCDECGDVSDSSYECTACGSHVCGDCIYSCNCGHTMRCPGCRASCGDCGRTICEDCSHSCNRCEEDHCSSCLTACRDCGDFVCNACSHPCVKCGRRICDNCGDECSECENVACSGCLADCDKCGTTGLCPNCLEENHDNCGSEETDENDECETAESEGGESCADLD